LVWQCTHLETCALEGGKLTWWVDVAGGSQVGHPGLGGYAWAGVRADCQASAYGVSHVYFHDSRSGVLDCTCTGALQVLPFPAILRVLAPTTCLDG